MARRLDTIRQMQTPEGVLLDLPLAGPLPRVAAFVIDLLLRTALYFVVGTPLAMLGDSGLGMLFIAVFVIEWFYPVVFEVRFRGATPGKVVLGLAVVHDDGTPVTWSSSIVRNLMRFADFLPTAYLIGLLTMTFHPEFKRLGDLVAGTIVVHRRAERRAAALPPGPIIPATLALQQHEQRAIIEYAERQRTWTEDRAEELAEILMPVIGGPPKAAVQRLLGMARWLRGER